MFVPSSWKAATHANATSAAATAYSESSRPDSSFKNFSNMDLPPGMKARVFNSSRQQHLSIAAGSTEIKDYLIFAARFEITVEMFVPRSWKAATQANATSAAATAYSESSRPDSSFKNFLIIIFSSKHEGSSLL